MTLKEKFLRVLWAASCVICAISLFQIWFVETPEADGPVFLPLAQGDFVVEQSDDSPKTSTLNQLSHFLWNPDHVKELEMAPDVERIVLQKQESIPITRSVEYLIVDGIKIRYDEDDDPVKGPILARVLQDAAQIEWRLLWERALTGTAAWAAALAAMGLITWRMKRPGDENGKSQGGTQ